MFCAGDIFGLQSPGWFRYISLHFFGHPCQEFFSRRFRVIHKLCFPEYIREPDAKQIFAITAGSRRRRFSLEHILSFSRQQMACKMLALHSFCEELATRHCSATIIYFEVAAGGAKHCARSYLSCTSPRSSQAGTDSAHRGPSPSRGKTPSWNRFCLWLSHVCCQNGAVKHDGTSEQAAKESGVGTLISWRSYHTCFRFWNQWSIPWKPKENFARLHCILRGMQRTW